MIDCHYNISPFLCRMHARFGTVEECFHIQGNLHILWHF
jgi:hypothetical protein